MSEYSIALEKQLEMHRSFSAMAQLWLAKRDQLERMAQQDPRLRHDIMAVYQLNRIASDAETFFVSAPIQRLLTQAAYADGLDDFHLEDFSPPARSGFVYFQEPLLADPDDDGDLYHCLAWTATIISGTGSKDDPMKFRVDESGRVCDPFEIRDGVWRLIGGEIGKIEVSVFALSRDRQSDLRTGYSTFPNYVVDWMWGDSLSETLARPATRASNIALSERIVRLLPTFCAFISQRILVAERTEVLNRATRRRLMAMHSPRVPVVNVVELRRKASTPHDDSDSHDVEWSCRWLVRGHWRRQWYPRQERHQMIWITPYVKGPEDKPLKQPRATVFAVVR